VSSLIRWIDEHEGEKLQTQILIEHLDLLSPPFYLVMVRVIDYRSLVHIYVCSLQVSRIEPSWIVLNHIPFYVVVILPFTDQGKRKGYMFVT
jgi:hypothetical protein